MGTALWIRRSHFGEAGEGLEDTNDHFLQMEIDPIDGIASARLHCYGCKKMVTVTCDSRFYGLDTEAECGDCGRTYAVEVE